MPLELQSVNVICRSELTAKFNVIHSTPGRDGTCLEEPLTLTIQPGGSTLCTLHIDDCKGGTPDEALARMSMWLRRLADGIEQRGTSVLIPLS